MSNRMFNIAFNVDNEIKFNDLKAGDLFQVHVTSEIYMKLGRSMYNTQDAVNISNGLTRRCGNFNCVRVGTIIVEWEERSEG